MAEFGICFLGGCGRCFHPTSSHTHPLTGTPSLFTQILLILQKPNATLPSFQEAFPDQPPTGAFSQQLKHFLSCHPGFSTNDNDDEDHSESY